MWNKTKTEIENEALIFSFWQQRLRVGLANWRVNSQSVKQFGFQAAFLGVRRPGWVRLSKINRACKQWFAPSPYIDVLSNEVVLNC